MEQNQAAAQYWMMMKRKHMMMKTRVNQAPTTLMMMKPMAFDHDTWEEKAFAEDAAGPLGECIWPPRSYSCSFCRREFRSAQALGGHMNVHRRDKARLKQSLSPQNDHDHDHDGPFCNTTSLIASSTSCLRANLDGYVKNDAHVDTDLTMGLNFAVRRDGDEVISCKRHKSFTTLFPFGVVKPCFSKVGSMEELDLELRLGGTPKVK